MRSCGVFGAVLLAIVMVPLLVFALLFNGFSQTVLRSPSFVAKLSPQNLQRQFNEALPYLVVNALQKPEDPDSKQLITSLFPDPMVQTMAIATLPKVFMQLNGDYSTATRQKIMGEDLKQMIGSIMSAAAECTFAQESTISIALKAKRPIGETLCNPREQTTRNELTGSIATQLRDGISGKPLLDNPKNPTTIASIAEFTSTITTLEVAATQSLTGPAILLVLIIALAVRSLRELFGWVGGLLSISGLLGLPIAFLNKSLITIDLHALVIQNTPQQAGFILPFLTIFEDPIFGDYVRWITTAYATILGVGIFLVMVALLWRREKKPLPSVISPMPGTPAPILGGNDGTTTPVAVEVETSEIPIGHVTKPLNPNDTTSATDLHNF